MRSRTLLWAALAWALPIAQAAEAGLLPLPTAYRGRSESAVLAYYLDAPALGLMTLEIVDSAGVLVRAYSSTDPIDPEGNGPPPLSNQPGLHRVLWDLRYTPLEGGASIRVLPGQYTVSLTMNGQTCTQPLTLLMDSRDTTPLAGIQKQFALSKQLYDDALKAQDALHRLDTFRRNLWHRLDQTAATGRLTAIAPIVALDRRVAALEGPYGLGLLVPVSVPPNLVSALDALLDLMRSLDESDAAPTAGLSAAVADRRAVLAHLLRSNLPAHRPSLLAPNIFRFESFRP